MIAEGSKVAYVGPVGHDQPDVGDQGRVLSRSGTSLHVMWSTGSHSGQVDLVPDEEVTPLHSHAERSVADDLADSLTHTGSFTQVAIREVYDESGPIGLLNSLAEAGHLASLGECAEEALQVVATRVREHDPIRQVLTSLDADEGEALVSQTAAMLLREAAESEEV